MSWVYDPQTGRFLQQDPIGFAVGDANLYRYVFNNPVNLIDPSGEVGVLSSIYGGISGGIGGYIASGGSLSGTIIGVGAGAFVGLVAPGTSRFAGSFAANAGASLLGQLSANGLIFPVSISVP